MEKVPTKGRERELTGGPETVLTIAMEEVLTLPMENLLDIHSLCHAQPQTAQALRLEVPAGGLLLTGVALALKTCP